MNQECVNVAYMGENGKNAFLAKLLGLYNSNNLNTKYHMGAKEEDIVNDFSNILEDRKSTIDNNMPIIWNFKMDKRNINIYSIDDEINDIFNNALVQCNVGLFYIKYKTSGKNKLDIGLKNQILLANILGLKSAFVYIDDSNYIPESQDWTKTINKIRDIFIKKNFKSNRVFIISKFNRECIGDAFKEYFKLESRRKNQNDNYNSVCLPVSNIFPLVNKYYGLNATLIKGSIQLNDFLVNSRNKAVFKIEELQVAHKPVDNAYKGNNVGIKLKNASEITRGDILVKKDDVLEYYTILTAQVLLIDDEFDKNTILSINTIGRDTSVKVVNIQKTINNLNKTIEKRPESLKKGDTGIVVLQSRGKLPLKLYSQDYTLGSFLIKNELEKVIGVGIVKNLK